jgi:hypothetical protein
MAEKDILDSLDSFLGTTRPKKASPILDGSRKLSDRIDQELRYLKTKCLDGPGGCNSPTGSKKIYKSGRCEFHYKIHEAFLAKRRSEEGRESVGADGYVRAYDKEGRWRLKHRIVMEEKLGRTLERSEVVKFKDGDKTNCTPENLYLQINGPLECPHCGKSIEL